jgi:hypothetical protein
MFEGMSVGELQAEEDLILQLTAEAHASDIEPETPTLPADLDAWAPDLLLAAVLSVVDVDTLTGADRVRYLKAQHRLNSAGQARLLGAVNSISDAYDTHPEDLEDPNAGASMELRAALRWTRRAADTELNLAADLRHRLPRLFEALSGGLVDRPRTRILVRHTDHLPPAHARLIVDTLIEDAGTLTTGQLIEAVRRACLDIDPTAARHRYHTSRHSRRVVTWSDPDGTVTLSGIGLDPVEVAAAKNRIDRLARHRRSGDPTKSIDQHRADIFTDLLNGETTDITASIHLTVDLATLARLNNDSADLAGYGPIAADITRQITRQLGEDIWDWTLHHPHTGMPLADGTTRRRPTTSQARKIRAKNGTCIAPGCRIPAVDCDIDHTRTWAETGITDTQHLAPLCRHDHTTRHHAGWTYQPHPNGDYQWTSPLGTTYTTTGHDP